MLSNNLVSEVGIGFFFGGGGGGEGSWFRENNVKGFAMGVFGCMWPFPYKPFFKLTIYNGEVAKTGEYPHSVTLPPPPPFKNPGYAHEE